MIEEPAFFQKTTDEYPSQGKVHMLHMWQTLFSKWCFNNQYKEGAQYLQYHYQEGVHGNFPQIMNQKTITKNIEVDKLKVENAKEQEKVDNENKPKIMLGMKIPVNFDTSILTPVAVVNKEPNTSVQLWSPAAKFMTELQKKSYDSKPFRPFRL